MTLQIGNRDADLRYDPFDFVLRPETILGANGPGNGEVHQVEPIVGLPGRYGFSPIEMPLKNLTMTNNGVSIIEVDSDNNPIDGAPTMTIARPQIGAGLGTNEFFVDFNNPELVLNSGRFFFHPSKNSKFFRINYFAIGGINNVKNIRSIELDALHSKLSRDGSLSMGGDLNLGLHKLLNMANGTNPGDGVNLSQLLEAIGTRVAKAGDSMTGPLSIPNPTLGNHAVNLTTLNSVNGARTFWTSIPGLDLGWEVDVPLPSSGVWMIFFIWCVPANGAGTPPVVWFGELSGSSGAIGLTNTTNTIRIKKSKFPPETACAVSGFRIG